MKGDELQRAFVEGASWGIGRCSVVNGPGGAHVQAPSWNHAREAAKKYVSGLYEGGTEPPKEEARLFTDADVKLLQWIMDDEKGDWKRHRRSVMSWRHVEAVSNLRDRINRSLIDSSVSPPQQTETPK